MIPTRRGFSLGAAALGGAGLSGLGGCATGAPSSSGALAGGVFEPTWDSLIENYRTPDWYRDAKLGIWAHWSAQCVPEQGDWYARHMYEQGHSDYEFHVRTYGHPSQVGFMELNNLWKAENWDPDYLLGRFKAAGAKYFFALANHHDNFDNYNSRHHEWNSVNVGPKKDLIGIWARAAREKGLKFGVSNHSAHAWHWFQTCYAYDAEGPMAGRRYDAHHLRREHGAGKWWEGLDPQALYTGPTFVPPDGITTAAAMHEWHEANDRVWTEEVPRQNMAFVERWKARTLDLLDSYEPDLVYYDNGDMPLGQAGLDIAAHYYNSSMRRNRGKVDVVMNVKFLTDERQRGVVNDWERRLNTDVWPLPWQTDTCLGHWHYRRSLFDERGYKTADWVIQALCDIVSKNGNLLLSVPMRGDGTIDSEEEKILDAMGAWMAINGDALFGTRPWRRFGEGPPAASNGAEGTMRFSGRDIRFTRKNGDVYALVLGWPEGGRVRIESMSRGSQYALGEIERVELLGSGPLDFRRETDGLHVALPAGRQGEIAYALKVSGRGLI